MADNVIDFPVSIEILARQVNLAERRYQDKPTLARWAIVLLAREQLRRAFAPAGFARCAT